MTKKIDWKKEHVNIENYQGENWFKPEAGTYKIVFIGEPVEDSYLEENGTLQPQILADIQVKEVFYKWTITKGKTPGSLYGQILKVLASNDYLWAGLVISVIVTGTGKNKRYAVVEANR